MPTDIIFNPPVNKENQYIRLLVDELRGRGYRIHPLDTIFSSRRHFRTIKLVHLNWFENIDDRSFFVALRSFLRKLMVLIAIRLSGKCLIWTMHNRASHEKKTAFFSRLIIRLLVRWSHRIVIHVRQSEALLALYGADVLQRIVYIPHPNFIAVYGAPLLPLSEAPDRLQLLFAGMLKPYKNLELLIEVVGSFGKDVQLTVAGKAPDGEYEQQLRHHAARFDNVRLLPYFIPDNEVARLLADADAMVLPYDLASSLNAGTAILSFSYQKTVICPEIGTILDLGLHMADTFHYRYSGMDQHRTELTKQINRALQLKRQDPDSLKEMGQRLYKQMATMHHPERVGDMLDLTYRQCFAEVSRPLKRKAV